MQLTAEIGGTSHHVSFQREETTMNAEIDGRRYEISVRRIDRDVYLFVIDGQTFECRVAPERTGTNSVVVHLGRDAYPITLVDPRRLRGSNDASRESDGGAAQISSPMAGKVVRVLVEIGEHVKAGDGVVVVEAMKMQNELKSPHEGVVTELRAEAGSTVSAGEVLAVVA